jgi:predicted nuclease with TOPRIM domain
MKKILIVTIFIGFLVPNITLAAWWNPFSWFGADADKDFTEDIIETSINDIPVDISTSTEEEVEKPKDKNKNEIREIIKEIEVPVIKTVEVINPETQKELERLRTENYNLKLEISILEEKINKLSSEIEELDDVKEWFEDRFKSSDEETQKDLDYQQPTYKSSGFPRVNP